MCHQIGSQNSIITGEHILVLYFQETALHIAYVLHDLTSSYTCITHMEYKEIHHTVIVPLKQETSCDIELKSVQLQNHVNHCIFTLTFQGHSCSGGFRL